VAKLLAHMRTMIRATRVGIGPLEPLFKQKRIAKT
jgi:hypothetical protein